MQTYMRRKNKDKRVIEFDQPRSDLSVFLCPPSVSNLTHHQQESAGSIEKSSLLIEFSPDEKIDTKGDELDLPLAQWTRSQNKRRVATSETSAQKVSSTAKLKPVISWSQSNADGQGCDVCLIPGSVVWAKKASQMWWPAKVLRVKVLELNSGTEDTGGLRVQYYGSEKSDWVDPARDLSPFEECFEERSCNPSEEFQEALKQAIHQKEHQSSARKLTAPAKGHVCLNSTNSSKTEHDLLVKERSKRRRKPKVHFDELNVPLKPEKDSRRLRIMRSLGLAPPIGSPFAQSRMQE